MSITNLLSLMGGLALFLYGMQMMSDGLEAAAGNKMKQILEKLTANRVLGVAVGALITAIIQSSSATTVMVVGFVNSGMMTLRQAVWIIMGANIGTTITGQLIALDVGMLAPLFAFAGVAMIVFLKNPKAHHFGAIIAGLGVLFIGMEMMGDAMKPLREVPEFVNLMTTFSNPIIGIGVGAIFTAIIQSSSASVGILQSLAANGLVGLGDAVFVLFGQNIGTCITAVLAAIGTSRNAKRTTVIHLSFNIIGTTIFTIVCLLFPLTNLVESFTPGNVPAQIANMHTLFNIVTTLILLPVGQYLASFAEKIMPDPKGEVQEEGILALSNNEFMKNNLQLGFSAVYMKQLGEEIGKMLRLAKENVNLCFQAIIDQDLNAVAKADETEETIDLMNKELGRYISKILMHDKTGKDIEVIEEYFRVIGNIERIGDHAVNISGYVHVMDRDGVTFSEEAQGELRKMQEICEVTMGLLSNMEGEPTEWLSKIAALEQQVDDMTTTYRDNHIERMKKGLCSEQGCILFSELLTDFERMGDHMLNIAQAYAKISMEV
ncbi:MAG: Na/Pi cotransporter family protein [Lachnospiraceae bacterium]|nr:Na/Pi cotransporter family protein [Lachnospiraceae bacterium]